jgi:hypothetical protein
LFSCVIAHRTLLSPPEPLVKSESQHQHRLTFRHLSPDSGSIYTTCIKVGIHISIRNSRAGRISSLLTDRTLLHCLAMSDQTTYLLLKNGTALIHGENDRVEALHTDILISGSKISEVAPNIAPPPGSQVMWVPNQRIRSRSFADACSSES